MQQKQHAEEMELRKAELRMTNNVLTMSWSFGVQRLNVMILEMSKTLRACVRWRYKLKSLATF